MEEFVQMPFAPNYEISWDGVIRHTKTKTTVSYFINRYVYYRYNDGIKPKLGMVHRAVAITFIPNPHNLPYINHKDGNKINNRVANLEWCTCLQNIRHGWDTGLTNNKGENHGRAKLKETDIPQIRKMIKNGNTLEEIAKVYNIHKSTIFKIKQRVLWTHV